MSIKSITSLMFALMLFFTFAPACASKKYVRTTVNERVSPIEGRATELESGVRGLKDKTDNLENQTNALDATTKKLQTDLSDLDERSSRGIEDAKEEAKRQASLAKQESLAETAKVDGRVNKLDNWQEQQVVTINFKVNQATLTNESKTKLDSLVNEILGQNGYILEVKGFTDATGSVDANRKLSQLRAQSVFQYLVEKDVPSYKINMVGVGEIKPISDNKTKSGRAENRRVEIRLLINEGIKPGQLNVLP